MSILVECHFAKDGWCFSLRIREKNSVLSNTRFVCLFVFVCTIPVFVLFEPV